MSDRDFWVGAARRLALRRNVASWADGFVPAALGITVVAAVGLLAARVIGPAGMQLGWLWCSWGAALGVAGVVCAAIAGRRLFGLAESLARLDEVEGLHNRLTAAHAGVGPWPGRKAGVRDAVRWNWGRLGVPAMIGGLLLGAAALVELPRLAMNARPSEEPVAWTQLESWLQKLDQAKVLDQAALEKLKEQVDDLRNQPAKDWYSQSSLEAGDALRQQTEQSLRDLAQNLGKSADLMAQAQQAGQMGASQLQELSAALKEMAQGLQSGNLPANKELTAALGKFDPSTLKTMTPEQMRALQQRLNAGQKVCGQCVGPNAGNGTAMGGDGHRSGKMAGNEKQGDGASGNPGGGGPAALGLDPDSENLHTKRVEGDSNGDPSRALPGEVIAVAKGKQNVDKTMPAGPVAGGGISSAGEGGDAVWRDSLTPDEREVLQRYFK